MSMSAAQAPGTADAQQRVVPFLSFIIFFSVLNGTMFNVAIPAISGEFSLLPSEVSWVVASYIIFFAIGSVTYGKLADLYSVRNLITIGLILFNAGSLLGFFAQWFPMLIAARVIQACGAAAIPALGMIVATRYFPPQMRGRVLGIIASTVAMGSGIGPIVGGYITGELHWRYLFLISVFTLLAIPFLRKHLPLEERKEGQTFDTLGAFLLGGGIAAVLLSLSQLNVWYLVAGLGLLGWFAVHIRRKKNPFIQPSLLANRPYRAGLVTGFLAVLSAFGMMFVVPLMLQDLNELTASQIGLIMFPGALSAVINGALAGRLADKVGPTPIVKVGLFLLMGGYLLLSTFAGVNQWLIAAILLLVYLGFSSIQSALANAVSTTLPREQTGVGMGMYNLVFFISGAFGSTIVGKVLDFEGDVWVINPLNTWGAGVYSNVFVGFTVIVLVALAVFSLVFRGKKGTVQA